MSANSIYVFLALLCFASLVTSQGVSGYVEDGCYFVGGEKFGCMKSTLYDCDHEWFFQLTTPTSSEFEGAFVIASGIVPVYQDYYEMFSIENDSGYIEFSISFFDSVVNGNTVVVQGQFSFQRSGEESHSFPITDYIVTGTPCGDVPYFNLPCPSSSQRDYQTSKGGEVIVDTFNTWVHSGAYQEMFTIRNDCLIMRDPNSEQNIGPFFCPTVLYDTCTFNSMLTSRAGLTIKLPIGSGYDPKTCVDFDEEHSFCIHPQFVNMGNDYVFLTDLLFTLERNGGTVLYEWTMPELDFTFPTCGESHVECIEDYSFTLPGDSEFTSEFWTNWMNDSENSFTSLNVSEIFSLLFSTITSSTYWSTVYTFSYPTRHYYYYYSSDHHHGSPSSFGSSFGSSSDSSNVGAILGGISAALVAICVVIVVVVTILVYAKKRNASANNSDAVYELMTNQ